MGAYVLNFITAIKLLLCHLDPDLSWTHLYVLIFIEQLPEPGFNLAFLIDLIFHVTIILTR